MGLDTETGRKFFARKGRVIRFLEKHQGIPMDFWYCDTLTGREFDVRTLPWKFFGTQRAEVMEGDRYVHRAVIVAAIDAGYDFETHGRLPLPPDPEGKNNERAEWAETALTAFMQETGTDPCDAVADLLGNLMHYCDRHGLTFRDELARARTFYREETSSTH